MDAEVILSRKHKKENAMHLITFEKNFKDRAIDIQKGATMCVGDLRIDAGFIYLPLAKFGTVKVPASHVSVEWSKGRLQSNDN